jgi:hypothetical protein
MHPRLTRPSRRLAALLLVALSLALSACGIKGKPAESKPTEQSVAAQPADQSAAIASAVAATVTAANQAGAAAPASGGAAASPKSAGQNDAGSGKDAGDTSETALEIKSNTDAPYTGTLSDGDPADYYKLNIPAGSVATIEFQQTGKDGLLQSAFYHDGVNLGGAQIGAGNKWNRTWVLNNTDGGDYVLGVEGSSTYTFNIISTMQQDAGAEGDAGDESSAARVVQINTPLPLKGILGNNDKSDFYRFTLPTSAKLKITARVDEKSPGSVEIALFKADTALGSVGFIKYGSPGTLTADKPLDAGDYVLRVNGDAIYDFTIITENP